MYKAILFDLDGTLADTTEGVYKSAEYALEKMNIPNEKFGDLRRFIGPPLQTTFSEAYHMDKENTDKATAYFREYYGDKGVFMCKPYDNMNDTLLKLKAHGYKLGVATYKKDGYAKILLKDKFSDVFDVINGADSKGVLTKSEIIEKTIVDLKCEKSETVMIGDTIFDLEGALAAGIDFIAVTYGFGFTCDDDLKSSKNVTCRNELRSFNNPAEIAEYFLKS